MDIQFTCLFGVGRPKYPSTLFRTHRYLQKGKIQNIFHYYEKSGQQNNFDQGNRTWDIMA